MERKEMKWCGGKKMRKKIFGIGAVVILILVAIIPIVSSAQLKETMLENEILYRSESYLNKEDTNSEQDRNVLSNVNDPFNDPQPLDIGNNGITRYQKRLGWRYTLQEKFQNIAYAVSVAPLYIIILVGGGAAAVAALYLLTDYLTNGGYDPFAIISLAAAAATALLGILKMIHDQTVRKKIQDIVDAINALRTWLEQTQDYLEDMIITGWILGCKIGEKITIQCRGKTLIKNSVSSTIVSYNLVVPRNFNGEVSWQQHNCYITVTGSKHSRTLHNSALDAWCYSDGILENDFRLLI
jgi:hypothetical protein